MIKGAFTFQVNNLAYLLKAKKLCPLDLLIQIYDIYKCMIYLSVYIYRYVYM